MHQSYLRRLQRELRFEGAEDGFALAGWLLLNGNTADGREVIKLIHDLQRLMTLWPEDWTYKTYSKEQTDRDYEDMRKDWLGYLARHEEKVEQIRKWEKSLPRDYWAHVRDMEENKLIRRIDARLKKLFRPPAFLGFEAKGGTKRTTFGRNPNPKFLRAALIADSLENLGKLGLIHRIRQCLTCKRWIFARFERERFCSGQCREKAYRSSAQGRRKRRDYMHGYRARLKRMDRNNLKASAEGQGVKHGKS